MARIKLENIRKTFGKVTALDGVSFEIHDNEFFVLFGPAGAGKTTILNCVAGIMMPEEGTVSFDDKVMNLIEPAHRNVAMVFENYALYPNMTVYDNMASALRSKLYKTDEQTIRVKVNEAARMMKMESLLERFPSQLSNGQKQRVAMGRALVRDPNVFIMDEPLAHLDAKLRHSMRTELKEMQANLGSTCIYVTHDFMEAMSLGDRIAIIDKGKIIQVGSGGDEIYYMPTNEFVASLMGGDPQINIIPTNVKKKNGAKYELSFHIERKEVSIDLPRDKGVFAKIQELNLGSVDIGIRPQHVHYAFEKTEGYFKATVYSYESIGNKSVIIADCGDYQLRMIAPNGLRVQIDSDIYICPEFDKTILFDSESKDYIVRYDEEAVKAFATTQEVT